MLGITAFQISISGSAVATATSSVVAMISNAAAKTFFMVVSCQLFAIVGVKILEAQRCGIKSLSTLHL